MQFHFKIDVTLNVCIADRCENGSENKKEQQILNFGYLLLHIISTAHLFIYVFIWMRQKAPFYYVKRVKWDENCWTVSNHSHRICSISTVRCFSCWYMRISWWSSWLVAKLYFILKKKGERKKNQRRSIKFNKERKKWSNHLIP